MHKKNMIRGVQITCAGMFFVLSCALILAFAEKEHKSIKRSVADSVQGEVGYIDKNTISINYAQDLKKGDEYEMVFPLSKNVQVEHKQLLSEINAGDTVRVEFDNETEEVDGDVVGQKHLIKKVVFIKAGAPAVAPAPEEPAPADEPAVEPEPQQ